MGGSSGSSGASFPIFKELYGAYGGQNKDFWGNPTGFNESYTKSADLAGQLEGMLSGAGNNPFSQELSQALLNPSFGPTSSSEEALLSSIMDQTAGRGAVRGLGAPTQTALAQSIAPELIGMRQQNIQNLMGTREQNLRGLLDLVGLAMPQTVGGSATTEGSKGRSWLGFS